MEVAISVIMSVYNSEQFLKESIDSILNQTFKDFEFIIIDDCSTDNSNKIIQALAEKDTRIKLHENKKNIGLTKSLNKALSLSKGKYIARIDADDVSLPERFQEQFNFLEKNTGIFLLGSWAVEFDELGNKGENMTPKTNFADLRKILPKQNNIIHPSIMFRNEKGIAYREKFIYAQDYDFYLNLLSEHKKLENIPEFLIKYRVSRQSVSIAQKGFQRFFTQKAKQFYAERNKTGNDNYSSFQPEKEFKNSDKIKLEGLIYSALKIYNPIKIRKYCIKYFKKNGFFNKFLLYYILSFLKEKHYITIKKQFNV